MHQLDYLSRVRLYTEASSRERTKLQISRWILFLCLVVIGIWQVEDSYSQNNTAGYVDGENSSHTEPTKDIAIPVRIVSTPYDQQEADANAKAREEDNHREEANLAIQRSIADSSQIIAQYTPNQFYLGLGALTLSLITVIASGFAAWFAYGAVSEARKSTFIANQALSISADTAKKQLRAYLVLTGTSIPSEIPEGRFVVKTGFKNCGQTPARVTKLGYRAFVSTKLEPSNFIPFKMSSYNAIVGPGEEVHFHMGDTSSLIPEFRSLVAQGKLNLAMRIQAVYTDIYDIEHTIKFTRTVEGPRELNAQFALSEIYPDEFS